MLSPKLLHRIATNINSTFEGCQHSPYCDTALEMLVCALPGTAASELRACLCYYFRDYLLRSWGILTLEYFGQSDNSAARY